jgi:hypothetical protein
VIEMSRICPYVPGGSVVTPIASVTPIPQREPIEGLATLGDS